MDKARSDAGVANSDLSVKQVTMSTSPKVEATRLHIRKMLRRFVRWLDWEFGC
jgi:hypothetical protein